MGESFSECRYMSGRESTCVYDCVRACERGIVSVRVCVRVSQRVCVSVYVRVLVCEWE